MNKIDFVVITEEPIDATHRDENCFTTIGANKLVNTISFEIIDDFKVGIKESKNKLINHDILKGLDNTVGACLVRTTSTKPGVYHESWADADVELVGKFLDALKETINPKDENRVVKSIREKYRGKKLDKLI